MSVFADSSALVKLYSDEVGADIVRAVDVMIVSHVARVEVPAAFWRKQRLGELDPEAARVLTQEFEADFFGTIEESARFIAVSTSTAVLDRAAGLCAVHPLRTHDAIQLAGALATRDVEPGCATLAAFDSGLRRAAAAEGFALLPPR